MRPDSCVLGLNLTISEMKETYHTHYLLWFNVYFWGAQIVEGKYHSQQIGQKDYNELGKKCKFNVKDV